MPRDLNPNEPDFPRWTPEEYRRRPRDYDPGMAEQICDRVANGETLSQICADRDFPLPATFLAWVRNDSMLAAEYDTAKSVQCDVMMEEMPVVGSLPDSRLARNMLDARRLYIEKTMPEKYGPRSHLNVKAPGEDAGGVDYGLEVRRKLAVMAQRERDALAETSKS